MKNLLVAVVLAAVAASPAAAGDPKKEDVDKAQAKVKEFISKLPNGDHGEIVDLNKGGLNATLPNHLYFAVRYRIYPVARVMPEGYKPSNILVVNKDGKVEHVKDVKALTALFQANLTPAKDKAAAIEAAKSWLTLTQEFHQDGFYKFEVSPQNIFVSESDGKVNKVDARALVMAGGNGDLMATLNFADGKLKTVQETAKLREGPRPICQATKLLDADSIVRRMAEQDLLYMGVAARGYLMEQRAKAGTELREAIDRLWRRIEANGW